jgi:hypothetical protein
MPSFHATTGKSSLPRKKKKKDSILPARIVKGGPLPWEKFVFGATVAGQGQIYP